MNIYTVGMIKAFLDCPLKFHYIFEEHLDIPMKDDLVVSGKKIHSLINYYFNGYDISKMIKIIQQPENANLADLWNNFISLNIKNAEQSEYTFNVILNNNVRLSGRIDAIRNDGSNIEILDWKTGCSKNVNPEEDIQTIVYMYSVYNLLLQEKKITAPENLLMTYCFLKENVRKTVYFSNKKYLEYEKFLNSLTYKMQNYNVNEVSVSINEINNKENIYSFQNHKCSDCVFKIICKGAFEGMNDML